MQRTEKERVVEELVEQLRSTESLLVADYRGLTNADLVELRAKVRSNGGRFQVVKNTLTRRAAEEAGVPELLELLDGPTAIAFVGDGDMVGVAKALSDSARQTRILSVRGGILQGKPMSADQVRDLAALPPADVLRGQVLGAIVAPLNAIAGLINAPLQNLLGLIDARIEQLEAQGGNEQEPSEAPAADEPAEEEGAAAEEEEPEEGSGAEAESDEETTTAEAEASAPETEEE